MTAENAALAIDALRSTDCDNTSRRSSCQWRAARQSARSTLSAPEIAAITDRARRPAAGEIRLQWWADAPRARATAMCSRTGGGRTAERHRHLSPAGAAADSRAIAARRFDLYQDPMPDRLPTFGAYAGETVSAFLQLAAMISMTANGRARRRCRPSRGGTGAYGHLRAFGYNASKGRIFLP